MSSLDEIQGCALCSIRKSCAIRELSALKNENGVLQVRISVAMTYFRCEGYETGQKSLHTIVVDNNCLELIGMP